MKYIPLKLWFILFAFVAVILFFVVLSFMNKAPEPKPEPQRYVPMTLQITNDPPNFITLLKPTDWTFQHTSLESTKGLNTTSPIPQQADVTEFISPSGTKLTFQIYDVPPTCPIAIPVNSNFGPYPASFDEASNLWSIATTDATIVVSISNMNTAADKQIINEIFKTFEISNHQPFECTS